MQACRKLTVRPSRFIISPIRRCASLACDSVPHIAHEIIGVLSVGLRNEGERTYFLEESPRIRRTEVRPTWSRRAISALATPARCSFRISAA